METLGSFKDRPEEVKTIWCNFSDDTQLELEWKEPECNNCKILRYNVYLSQHSITNASLPKFNFDNSEQAPAFKEHQFAKLDSTDNLRYLATNLLPDTIYYFRVNAENELGEGYNGQAFMVRTAASPIQSLSSLYVWGYNFSSQLALKDE